MGKALGESSILEHVKPLSGGVLYVDIKAPARLRPLLGFTNYRKSLESRELNKKTRERATELIAEYHRLKREAEQKLGAADTRRLEEDRAWGRRFTLGTFNFSHSTKIDEFVEFCTGGFSTPEMNTDVFEEAVRRLTASKDRVQTLTDLDNYITFTSKCLDTARRLLDACKATPTPQASAALDKTLTVSRLTEKLEADDPPTPDTLRQYRRAVSLFVEAVGDLPLTEVTRERAREFRDYLHTREDLAFGTCSQRMKKMVAIFNFAKREGYVGKEDLNPFHSMNISTTVKEGHGDEDPGKYLPPEIINVYLTEILPQFQFNDSMRWPILIMLHTGMRVEECCGLRVEEVTEHWGVNCFHLRPRKEDNRTIKGNKPRYTPIHLNLWETLGLRQYVKQRKDNGETMLFDFAWWRKKFYSSQFQMKMSAARSPIEESRGINLGDQHDYRHTLNTLLHGANVTEEHRCLITGHSLKSRVNAGYGDRDAILSHLLDDLHRMDLSMYDFSKLALPALVDA